MPTRHVKKIHIRRRYATCPQGMPKKREEKDSPYPRKKGGERGIVQMSSSTKQKLSTHLHILIKVYDLVLLWI